MTTSRFSKKVAKLAFLSLGVGLLTISCSPGIGDSCSTSDDCAYGHECDTSQPGGYCTISPCPRDGCPSESVCVDFGNQVSYCMLRCGTFAYCRDGYECVADFTEPENPETTVAPFCNQSPLTSSVDAAIYN